ncbi:uncharacterized protein LOC134245238 [Saccostrea cucullata]|uniref:uncharacterized protein LOC134245238 n=1 Tax=Saccostrea cuccullata TaxID=36930 RepID=UPI002ED03F80
MAEFLIKSVPNFALVSTVLLICGVCGEHPTVYITHECGKIVKISDETIVELGPGSITTGITDCRMDIRPIITKRTDHTEIVQSGVVLSIDSIRLSRKTAGRCLDNSIDIYDGAKKLNKEPLCGRYLDQSIFSTDSTAHHEMGIELKSNSRQKKIQFKAFATPFHKAPCYSDEFSCENGRCIAIGLICNTHNNCGDGSDEFDALCNALHLTTAAIVGIVFGVFFGVFMIPALVIWLCCRMMRRRRLMYRRI